MALHLVTGGAGFIGSSIAEALLSAGDTVRILDDFSSGRRENVQSLPGRHELIEGTIVDPETVTRAMHGVEVVFHEAAIPSVFRSVEEPRATMLAGVQGTTVVLDAARRAGVRRVVFAASSSAYGETPTLPKVETMVPQPLSPYAVSKLTCEQLLRVFSALYGLETVSLRYFNVFGPRQDPKSQYAAAIPNFVTAALSGRPATIFGDGGTSRDFCFIDNVVEANLKACEAENVFGEVFNIACGRSVTLLEAVDIIGKEVGNRIAPKHEAARVGDIRHSLADISKAKARLGYTGAVSFDEGIERSIAWYRRT
jgi:UDP-glucose 4-epimerase